MPVGVRLDIPPKHFADHALWRLLKWLSKDGLDCCPQECQGNLIQRTDNRHQHQSIAVGSDWFW